MSDSSKYLNLEGLRTYTNKLKTWTSDKIDEKIAEIPIPEAQVSYNNLLDKPFGDVEHTFNPTIQPGVFTGSNWSGISPLEMESLITEGEYQLLEVGQTYNILYNGVLYENVPVQRKKMSSVDMDFYCLGNWDGVVMRSNLMARYYEGDGFLEDDGLPFVMAQLSPNVTDSADSEADHTPSCAFAFFIDSIGSQTFTITDASDSTKSYSFVVPGSSLYMRTPFEYTDPAMGHNLSSVITDGQFQTITVNGTDVDGVWKVYDREGGVDEYALIFVPEGHDADATFPNGIWEEPDSELLETWPCLVCGTNGDYRYLTFYNLIRDKEDSRCYQHISFSLESTTVDTLDDKYLSEKYQDIFVSEYSKVTNVEFGLLENDNAFINTSYGESESIETYSAVQTGSDDAKYLLAEVIDYTGNVFESFWGKEVKIVFGGEEYVINIPIEGEAVETPVIPVAIPIATLGNLIFTAINQGGARGIIMYILTENTQVGETLSLDIYAPHSVFNDKYTPTTIARITDIPEPAQAVASGDTGYVTAEQVYNYVASASSNVESLSESEINEALGLPNWELKRAEIFAYPNDTSIDSAEYVLKKTLNPNEEYILIRTTGPQGDARAYHVTVDEYYQIDTLGEEISDFYVAVTPTEVLADAVSCEASVTFNDVLGETTLSGTGAVTRLNQQVLGD